MITSKYRDEDSNEWTIHHNGDYSGDAVLTVDMDRLVKVDSSTMMVEYPFQVLCDLVLDYLRSREITNLENSSHTKLIERYSGLTHYPLWR